MKFTSLSVVALILVISSGCGQDTSVSGSVEYNGSPVKNGYLSLSATESGQSFAAPINSGRYEISEVKPGTYTAVATGFHKLDHYSSSAEAYAKAGKGKGARHTSEDADYIASSADGNSISVEVEPGAQVIDLSITGPAATR